MMRDTYKSVTIVGLGVVGGSVARALKRSNPECRILAVEPDAAAVALAKSSGVIDDGGDDEGAVSRADVVIYATPLDSVIDRIRFDMSTWRPDCLVMDVASLKGPVLAAVRGSQAEGRWIGAHPMVGGERTGFGASRADLFDGARVWLVEPLPDHALAGRAETFWSDLGGQPVWTDAEVHDRRMIAVSHLPQVTANALASLMNELGVEPDDLGSGGRDMVRLAGSAPEVWLPLFEISGPELQGLLARFARRVEAIAATLVDGRRGELTALMEETRSWKERSDWS